MASQTSTTRTRFVWRFTKIKRVFRENPEPAARGRDGVEDLSPIDRTIPFADQPASSYFIPRHVLATRPEHHKGDCHGISLHWGLAVKQPQYLVVFPFSPVCDSTRFTATLETFTDYLFGIC